MAESFLNYTGIQGDEGDLDQVPYRYIAIDLKSFYASVECQERNLNPLTTNLVVADEERTEKTICLAVSPSLKAYGIPGRARLFEVVQKVKEVNQIRKGYVSGQSFEGKSYDAKLLEQHKEYEVSYIVAKPRMALYLEYSTRIYNIYLKYIAPEDIHVYSIDEVFIDAAKYLRTYKMSTKELAKRMILDIYETSGITATAGIGTNLYLCKVAMDIEAKHTLPDCDGVRIAQLDEMSYRKKLWNHQPITDFWRIGRGYCNKLQSYGLYTMGDIARCSVGKENEFYNEDLLYKLFGINAELLIDHAWGWEPCTIDKIKQYKPRENCISNGQVLQRPYEFEKGRLIVQEMADVLSFDIFDKGLVTNQIVLTIGYDIENLNRKEIKNYYKGEIKTDHFGRQVPKHAHGTINLKEYSSLSKDIVQATLQLFEQIANPNLLIRRVNVTANHLLKEDKAQENNEYEQLDLFTDYEALEKERQKKKEEKQKEQSIQRAMLDVKKKFGKNAMVKGMNLQEGAMTIERNKQIGGHKA